MIFDPAKETKLHGKTSSIGYRVILFQKMNGKQRAFAYSIGDNDGGVQVPIV